MISKFKPTWMIPMIYNISPVKLEDMGIKYVFTDLDNTLIPWNNPYGTPQLRNWLNNLSKHNIELVVISNNKRSRVKKALEMLDLDFISRSLKPFPNGINKALKKYHLNKKQVIMVGDQLLTDVWASNNAGVRSVLVKPLIETDAWNTKPNRFIEKKIWKNLNKKYVDLKWQEDIND
ncbi:YqeG family HAD IIIA-type phosphatase [Apilactobacillus timberlakei]|uniref:YqeG family HAD IIIA-type phosphatase n=1 Tax=Apilactobacillus timberlakei TaxID=2008380 RepID=A0ABY2YTN9_9LACO|nr:YqeG family HAD IIIA-type phosphatase [Apilactobacillus timberlakei]TPR14038.1 YqeG family HAD IIIA-type phosphatase [Apilactobacillus timberlakei]TPR15354.1 YqeG family HAD IIIA-type phosphatase [Apilactobacillus timberlakei]TPR17245.1 YqeG family HAD IIIA-type phosphatase [Apilactobacillus timberlakei]